MATELKVLALAGLLQVVQFALMAVPLNLQLGTAYTAGPRDEPPSMTGNGARLYRAFNNHFEALTLFTIAVVVVVLGNQSSAVTVACAWIYLAARILYVPAYLSGIPYLRSAMWSVGLFATATMMGAALI